MKNYIILFFVLAVWCALLPCLPFIDGDGAVSANTALPPEAESSEEEIPSTPCFYAPDTELVIYIRETNTAKVMGLESYVECALAAVMAEDSPKEALKAQAAAIRSLALNRKHSPAHSGFDLCTDSFCCYPVAEKSSPLYAEAAEETKDSVLCYQGTPAMALSHLSSCISTEPYGDGYPYLACVKVDNEKSFDCYKTVYSFTESDFKKRFKHKSVAFTEDHLDWVGKTEFTEGNRVLTTELCGTSLTGREFAAALGLHSLCFSVTATDTGFDVYCYGSGSGYGMSRCSAVLMASQGADCSEILRRFYPKTVITRLIY